MAATVKHALIGLTGALVFFGCVLAYVYKPYLPHIKPVPEEKADIKIITTRIIPLDPAPETVEVSKKIVDSPTMKTLSPPKP
jgi:hypothetical protein